MTKRKWLALTLILAWLCGVALNAGVPTTFVTGSLNLPSGSNPSNVTIKLTPSQSFSVTDSGGLKYQVLAPTTYSVTNSGVLAMYVVPNTGAGNYPDWTTYTAEIFQSGRVVATQTWQLASSSLPVTVANIITNSTVTTTPTNALPLAGGTMLGPIILGSNSSQAGLVWPPSTAPSTAPEGATYIDSVTGKLNIRFGGVWVPQPTVASDAAQTLSSTRKITTTAALPIGTAAAGTGIDAAAGDHRHDISSGYVTNAMLAGSIAASKLAGSITGDKISTLPDNFTNVSAATDSTWTATGDECITGDFLRLFSSGSAAPVIGGLHYNSTKKAFAANGDSASAGTLIRCVFQSTSSSTAITAATATDFSVTYTLTTAGAWSVVGKRIRITLTGIYTSTATPANLGPVIKYDGSTFINMTSVAMPGSQTAQSWKSVHEFRVSTAGASGVALASSYVQMNGTAGAITQSMNGGTSGVVDLTTAGVISVGVTLGTAGGNSVTMQSMTIEEVH